ncbi:MAG: hypothetical protein ACTHJ0_08650 [Flavipsychrobacter sp.]
MNINEVPQDERDFKGGDKLRKLVYAVDKDGKYTSTNSAGWEAENFAMKQAWDAVEDKLAETEAKVKAGELSPIAYFMEKTLMDTALLAKYMGKWQWQVKRHMKPAVFNSLSPELLQRYASVFNIPVETLKNFGKAQ